MVRSGFEYQDRCFPLGTSAALWSLLRWEPKSSSMLVPLSQGRQLGNGGASSPGSSEPEQQAARGGLRAGSVLVRGRKETRELGTVCEGAGVGAGAGSFQSLSPGARGKHGSTRTILFSVQTFEISDQHLQPSLQSLVPPQHGQAHPSRGTPTLAAGLSLWCGAVYMPPDTGGGNQRPLPSHCTLRLVFLKFIPTF